MVKCTLSPQEFIRHAFPPRIGVLCSPQAQFACRKNNLDFIELLDPFCLVGTELQFKEPNGTVLPIRSFRLRLEDVNMRPPQSSLAKKFLHSAVSRHAECRKTQRFQIIAGGAEQDQRSLNVPTTVPWYEAWRDMFLQVQYPADHEFTRHLLACILVISSADMNPVDTLTRMSKELDQLQLSKHPKWFSKKVLRYFVIVHDNSDGDNSKAVQMYELLKMTYDVANCFLLRTNSRLEPGADPPLSDPWSQYISTRMPAFGGNTSTLSAPDNIGSDRSPSSSTAPLVGRGMTTSLESAEEMTEATVNELMENISGSVVYHPLSPDNGDDKKDFGVDDADLESAKQQQHGVLMTCEDLEQIKLLLHEFCTQALVPYMEAQLVQLQDMITTKKGVSKSLLTATKRWFTPTKPNSSTTVNVINYASDSPEMQMRKLGDLYFMLGAYSLAYQAYHSAKRDFNSDQAWVQYAAALEMAALSAFMANEANAKTFDYMEYSITTYLNACKLPQFATRATILSVECLKERQLFGQAAHQLIRMTSEESDLRSAVLLEQAAYCFLEGANVDANGAVVALTNRSLLLRKYAFHLVLAGHRYSKAGQRQHSLRCYLQARDMYKGRNWNFAEDHINYTIGRLANTTAQLDEALQSYSLLLTGDSRQSPQQQELFLREYLGIYNAYIRQKTTPGPPMLPLPLINSNNTKVLVGPATPLRTPGRVSALGVTFADESLVSTQKWTKLEEMLVQAAQGTLPLTFKPMVALFTNNNIGNVNPTAVLGEPIKVAIKLCNPLQVSLQLSDIYLVWHFTDITNNVYTNESGGHLEDQHVIRTHVIRSATIAATEEHELVLHVTPLSTGSLVLKGIHYSIVSGYEQAGTAEGVRTVPLFTSSVHLHSTDTTPVMESAMALVKDTPQQPSIVVRGWRQFDITGPRILRKEHMAPDFRFDRRLHVNVVPTAACLQVTFCELPNELLSNEIQLVTVDFRNVGPIPLHNIHLATSMPHLLLCPHDLAMSESGEVAYTSPKVTASTPLDWTLMMENPTAREREARKNHVAGPLKSAQHPQGKLDPGQVLTGCLWLKAPEAVGPSPVDLFVYYESVDRNVKPRYRIVRHIWNMVIQESVSMKATVQSSCCQTDQVEQVSISMCATNQNMLHHSVSTEVSLLSVGMLSPNWRLTHEMSTFRNSILHSQESTYVLIKAQRVHHNKKTAPLHSEIALNAYATFNDYAKPSLDFAKYSDTSRLNVFDDYAMVAERSKKHPPDDKLILRWSANCIMNDKSEDNKRVVIGQTVIAFHARSVAPAVPIGSLAVPPPPMQLLPSPVSNQPIAEALLPASSNASLRLDTCVLDAHKLDQLRKQLHYTLMHSPWVKHDFAQRQLCVVPVQLNVHNITDSDVIVTIHTIGTSSDAGLMYGKTTLYNPYASNYFRWLRAGCAVRTVAAHGSVCVPLAIGTLAPGTFDLASRLQIWCSPAADGDTAPQPTANNAILQSYRCHSALIVADASK